MKRFHCLGPMNMCIRVLSILKHPVQSLRTRYFRSSETPVDQPVASLVCFHLLVSIPITEPGSLSHHFTTNSATHSLPFCFFSPQVLVLEAGDFSYCEDFAKYFQMKPWRIGRLWIIRLSSETAEWILAKFAIGSTLNLQGEFYYCSYIGLIQSLLYKELIQNAFVFS
jgi:hypothetical protein